jgi:Family of unknown function (DUF6299)
MRARGLHLSAIVALALVPLVASPASAAPPANDDPAGALPIAIGDRLEQDTTEATTDATDASLNNDNCGAPATNVSVWYSFSPTADAKVLLDTSESDYSTGLMVFKGTPSDDSFRGCGPVAVGLNAKAGKTYTIMAFSDDPSSTGGNLVLSATKAATPKAHVTVANHGVAYHGRGGAAKVHGTYSCTHNESFSEVDAHLLQRAGRLKIQAVGGQGALCDGHRHKWSIRLVSQNGYYARGRAIARAAIISCGLIECAVDRAKSHVRLSWASGQHRQWMTRPTSGRTEHARPLLQVIRQRNAPKAHWGTR